MTMPCGDRGRESASKPRKQPVVPSKIVSGGQTGVDRAALDVALAVGIAHGGWCPRGRRAEDWVIPSQYLLTEADSLEYAVRTEKNVLESDGTLILCRGVISGGTKLTRQLALEHGKPCLVVDLDGPPPRDDVYGWISQSGIKTLNESCDFRRFQVDDQINVVR